MSPVDPTLTMILLEEARNFPRFILNNPDGMIYQLALDHKLITLADLEFLGLVDAVGVYVQNLRWMNYKDHFYQPPCKRSSQQTHRTPLRVRGQIRFFDNGLQRVGYLVKATKRHYFRTDKGPELDEEVRTEHFDPEREERAIFTLLKQVTGQDEETLRARYESIHTRSLEVLSMEPE